MTVEPRQSEVAPSIEKRRERIHVLSRLDDLGGVYEGDWCGLAVDFDLTVEIEGYRLACTDCAGNGGDCRNCEGTGWDVLWQATSARTVEVHRALIAHEDDL